MAQSEGGTPLPPAIDREKRVAETIGIAYGFVRNQVLAINDWDAQKIKPRLKQKDHHHLGAGYDHYESSLVDFSSHYNEVYDYIRYYPKSEATIPNNPRYNELFRDVPDRFKGLNRKKLRFVFEGEEGISGDDPERIITLEEVKGWITKESEKPDGLLEGSTSAITPELAERFPQIDGVFNLAKILIISEINGKDDEWMDRYREAPFERFAEETFTLAVYKLAVGMAVLDQVIREAEALGKPIPSDFTSTQRQRTLSKDDPDTYPTVNELWDQARQMVADLLPNEEMLQDLFPERLSTSSPSGNKA